MKIVVLLLVITSTLKSASCRFYNSRKNCCCFPRFLKFFLRFLSEVVFFFFFRFSRFFLRFLSEVVVLFFFFRFSRFFLRFLSEVVVFPRLLRFFLCFLSEVEGVFRRFLRFFLRFFFCFVFLGFFLFLFLLRLHLAHHHLCKHFFKVFYFLWRGGGFFFSSVNIPRIKNNYSVCVCVFCTTQTVSVELIFSLRSGKKEKYENHFLIT